MSTSEQSVQKAINSNNTVNTNKKSPGGS